MARFPYIQLPVRVVACMREVYIFGTASGLQFSLMQMHHGEPAFPDVAGLVGNNCLSDLRRTHDQEV